MKALKTQDVAGERYSAGKTGGAVVGIAGVAYALLEVLVVAGYVPPDLAGPLKNLIAALLGIGAGVGIFGIRRAIR